jgi:hypothetical protein
VLVDSRFRLIIFAGAISIVIAAAGWFVWRSQTAEVEQPTSLVRNKTTAVTAEQIKTIVGRWRRPDGGYVLEIRGLGDGAGELDAGYFNPRPINVSEARVVTSGRGLHVFVELRDEGYPGATYQLVHDAAKDQLTGVYHQPSVNQSFDVYFVRAQ